MIPQSWEMWLTLWLVVVASVVATHIVLGRVWARRLRAEIDRCTDNLRDSKEFSDALIQAMTDGVSVLNGEGTTLEVNDAFCTMTGFSREELMRSGMPKLYWPPECYDELNAALQEVLTGNLKPVELTFQRKNGQRFPVWVAPALIEGDTAANTVLFATMRDISDIKRVETELRSSKAFLDKAQQVAHVGGWEWYFDTNRVQWSDEMCRINGMVPGEFKGTVEDSARNVHADDRALLDAAIKKTLESGAPEPLEYRIVWPDRSVHGVRAEGTLIVDDRGEAIGMVGTLQDVTRDRYAEQELRESEERFRTIYENAPVMINSFDSRGRCLLWNRECEKRMGWAEKEIRASDDPLALVYPDPKKRQQALEAIRGADGVFREYEVEAKDGEARIQSWADFRLPSGALIGVGYDITSSKRAEEHLKKSEERYSKLFHHSNDGVYVYDLDGKILDVNEKALNQLGYSKEELIGMRIKDLPAVDSRELLRSELENLFRDGFVSFEVNIKRKNGDAFPCEISGSMIQIGDKQVVQGIVRDITQRKRAEEELRSSHVQLRALASRLQAVREEESAAIAREIHDEFGQSLTGLKLDLAWIRRRAAESAQGDREAVLEKIDAMSGEIDRTIGAVRRLATQLRPVILDDLGLLGALEWQTQEFQGRTGIGCEFRLAENDYQLDSDRSTAVFRISQEILTNVARHANARHVEVSLDRDGDTLVMIVLDDGDGISDDDIHSTRALGILGMRERAYVCGGEVLIRRGNSGGTQVTVRIPLQSGDLKASSS